MLATVAFGQDPLEESGIGLGTLQVCTLPLGSISMGFANKTY